MMMDFLPGIAPDFGPRRRTQRRIDEARFGDGYAQRRPAGLNSRTDRWQLTWSMLDRDEFETLDDFLRARLGVHAFWWQPPWERQAKRYRCTDLSAQQPTSALFGVIEATLEEDHNP
ncbi:phage tail protein [Halomonas organivorans]